MHAEDIAAFQRFLSSLCIGSQCWVRLAVTPSCGGAQTPLCRLECVSMVPQSPMLFALWISGHRSLESSSGEGGTGTGWEGRGGQAGRARGRGRGRDPGTRSSGDKMGAGLLEMAQRVGLPTLHTRDMQAERDERDWRESKACGTWRRDGLCGLVAEHEVARETRKRGDQELEGGEIAEGYRRKYAYGDSGSGEGNRDKDWTRSNSRRRDQDGGMDRFGAAHKIKPQHGLELEAAGLVKDGRGWGGVEGVGLHQSGDQRSQLAQQSGGEVGGGGGGLESVRFALLASQMLQQQSQQSSAAGAQQSSAVGLARTAHLCPAPNGPLASTSMPAGSAMGDNRVLGTGLYAGGTNWSSLQLPPQTRSAVAPLLPALQGLQSLQTTSNLPITLNRGGASPLSFHPTNASVAAAAAVAASTPFSASGNHAFSAR